MCIINWRTDILYCATVFLCALLCNVRSSLTRYSWCSKRLIEERYSWSNQLTLADLIPLETPINSVNPLGGQWKERLIVGHNVSFDRAYIKEQYLLKVSIQMEVCCWPIFCLVLALCSLSLLLFFNHVVGGRFIISGNSVRQDIFLLSKGSKVRFMDTMSLHMAISGLTGFQRTLWMACKLGKKKGLQDVKEHIKKARHKKDGPAVCAHPM